MSHGDKVTDLPAGFNAHGQHRELRRSPAWPTMSALLRRAVPPGSDPHPQGGRILSNASSCDICGCEALWTAGQHRRRRHCHRAAGRRDDPGAARPVRRRRFLGGRRLAAPRHRRPAHLRVRRQRPAAPARRRSGDGDVRRAHGRQGDPRGCRRAFPPRPGRRGRSGAKRKIIGNLSSKCSKRKPQAARTPVAGARHHLPGRDRVGRRQDRQGACDQVATTTSAACRST
jgi:hypothetical protein